MPHAHRFGFCLGLAGLLSACAHAPRPPVARVVPHQTSIHGDDRIDDYFWLRQRDEPEVIAYLNAENEYTREVMKPTEKLQEKLYAELLSRIKETDLDVPVEHGGYFYYTRTQEGKQYPIHCRKKGGLEAAEEILLDQNRLAEGHKYFHLGDFAVSPDHTLLAYSTDTSGSESYTVFIQELATGKLLADRIAGAYYGLAWGNDNQTLFYTVHDQAQRPHKVLRHRLGADAKSDQLVHHEKDEAFHLYLGKTRSQAYILILSESAVTSEFRFVPADRPGAEARVIEPRRHQVEYRVAHHADSFYIVTNDGAKNFKLVKAPVENPSRENWQEVLPHRPDVKVDDLDAFSNHLVVYERRAGLKRIRVMDPTEYESHYVEFPEPVYTFWAGPNPEFDTARLRFTYTSLITPRSVFDYDMDQKTRELKKEYAVLGGYDRTRYQTERLFAKAEDGTRIPISIVYRKGLSKDGRSPLYLNGYGSYGSSYDPGFDSDRLSLLDRGFAYAIAHVRGGGEMGRPWYEAGKLLMKKNTFTDFIACAEHLIKEGYTSSDRLVVSGASAGGLLMGAVTNLRPDLFSVVVAEVPFVDVLNTMLDSSIPLTVIEYEEWGNPNEKQYYDYIRSYSPYDNVEAKRYPNLLITAGLNDPRVQYWEPAKWTAKLRAKKADDNLLLLKTKMETGHFGASGRYDRLREVAFEYAFLFDRLGIRD